MDKKAIPIVICGQVDHGKSTLIGRILVETRSLSNGKLLEIKKASADLGKDMELAFLLDQLEEERRQERTIDTTQVFFKTKKRKYCLIDTPGHVELIKNTMTGATQADIALLIVDVGQGVTEQTRRLIALFELLGIEKVLVAVNKMDLAVFDRSRFESVASEVELFFSKSKLKAPLIIPVSAKSGENVLRRSQVLRWHKGPTLLGALDSLECPTQGKDKPLRFPVQDIYRVKKEVLVLGRVASGRLKRGQDVIVLPSGKKTSVAEIRVYAKQKDLAVAGENIGVVLKNSSDIKRGDVLCQVEKAPVPFKRFQGRVFWLCDEPLSRGARMILRCATQELSCEIESIGDRMDPSALEILEKEAASLKLNEMAKIILKTERAFVVEPFGSVEELGRFVLESDGQVCAAGVVITGLE
jgi:sulfate adenylyltransferase large subunit